MVEVRHESFVTRAFVELLRKFSVAVALVDSDKHPLIADVTADFIYARLQRTSEKEKTGYPPRALDTWARRARAWADGGAPDDVPTVAGQRRREGAGRLRLHDLGRQGAQSGSRDGADRKAEMRWRLRSGIPSMLSARRTSPSCRNHCKP